MEKENRLIELFTNDFIEGNLKNRGSIKGCFKCPDKIECNASEKKHAMWTPVFGDPASSVMIIAKSPSVRSNKTGPFIGGTAKQWKAEGEKGINALYDFIKDITDREPYFIDLVKCGTKGGDITKTMIDNCITRFLLKEIRIIEPTEIICVSKEAFENISKLEEKIAQMENIKIVNLLHYSNQANLQLTHEDKKDIIWPLQYNKEKKYLENLKDIGKIKEWLKE